jgi:hypothetical protein
MTLNAFAQFRRGRLGSARQLLVEVERRAHEKGDPLTRFVVSLWLARVESFGGRSHVARRWLERACAIRKETRGFRVSPNWWSSEIVHGAHALGPEPGCIDDVGDVFAPPVPDLPQVAIVSGQISVDDHPVPEERWRIGRTGRRILRRYFDVLLAAYPSGLDRETVADLLWPDSDGDRAIANLYAATTDLRQLLADVPGVELQVADGRYALRFGPNVVLR